MIVGVECVPELEVNLAQIGIRNPESGRWERKYLTGDDYSRGILSAAWFWIKETRRPTEIFALHETMFDGTTNTLAGLLLVTIVTSTVKEAVANLDGMVNHLKTHINE